ncbi:hypothetical protein KY306_01590 [Candidatus Woesearchaeota archaeon]|nr:hypothetical protein [Candidatus Woesearchaeota archaeon]
MAELTHQYASLEGQTYGLIRHNPENRPFLSPTNQILGDVRAATRDVLKEWARIWLEAESKERDFEKQICFDPSVVVGKKKDTGGPIRRVLHQLSPAGIVNGLEYRARVEHQSSSFIRRGGDDAFTYNQGRERKGPKLEPQSGNVVLSGFVRQKGDARKGPFRSSFRQITVKGPFTNSSIPFALLESDSKYFQEIQKKGGFGNIQIMDMDIAALLIYADQNPDKVKDFPRKRKIALPFRTDTIDKETLRFFNVEELPYLSGTVTDLTPLKMDVLFAKYFKGENYFTLDKILSKLPVFNLPTIQSIQEGKSRWVVIPREFPLTEKKKFENLDKAVARLYSMIDDNLTEEGFELKDVVIEKKDSPYETLCLHYEKGDEIRRVTLDGRPPLIIRRRLRPNAIVYPVRNIEGQWHIDPLAELYINYKKGRLDDMTRTVTDYEVTMPEFKPGQFVPDSILRDYAVILAEVLQEHNKNKPSNQYPETFYRASDRAQDHGFTRSARMLKYMRNKFFNK